MEAETSRFEKAQNIQASDVQFVGQQTCEVQSQTDPEKTYTVDLQEKSCTCPDHHFRGTTCKHMARCANLIGMFELPDN